MQPDNLRVLVERTLRGDRTAARTIYDMHVNAVYRVTCRMVGRELAAECTQDTFVRAFERLATFRHQSALSTWLHAIAVSTALNRMRRERRAQRNVSLDGAMELAVPSAESDPLLAEKIRIAMDALPADLRAVVTLRLIEGYSHAEIAQMMDIAEGTSKARLSRARSLLRDFLADVSPGRALTAIPAS